MAAIATVYNPKNSCMEGFNICMLYCLSSLLAVRISITGICCKKVMNFSVFWSWMPPSGSDCQYKVAWRCANKKQTLQKPLKVSSWKGCVHLFFVFLEKQENILILAITRMHCRLVDMFSCQTSQSQRGKHDQKQNEKKSSVQSP